MKQESKLPDIFSLMRKHKYKRNMYEGHTEKVYTKTYTIKDNGSIPYIVTVAFDYRNIDKEEVSMYIYDDMKGEYTDLLHIPFIEEPIKIVNELFSMELELVIDEYE